LCVPSFMSNAVTRIFHNKKLDFPSNFSTLNLVVVVVLLATALIPIVVILTQLEKNTERLTNGSVKASYY